MKIIFIGPGPLYEHDGLSFVLRINCTHILYFYTQANAVLFSVYYTASGLHINMLTIYNTLIR